MSRIDLTLTTVADAEAASPRAPPWRSRARSSSARESAASRTSRSAAARRPGAPTSCSRERWTAGDGIEVWFADERCVGPEDEQSNYRMAARDAARRPPGSTPRRCTAWRASSGPSEGAARYARGRCASTLPRERSAALPVLDLIVLGIGPDGHVASLFPGAPTLDAGEQALCLGVTTRPSRRRSGSR